MGDFFLDGTGKSKKIIFSCPKTTKVLQKKWMGVNPDGLKRLAGIRRVGVGGQASKDGSIGSNLPV